MASAYPWWRLLVLGALFLLSVIISIALIGAAPRNDYDVLPFLHVEILSYVPYIAACAFVLATKPAIGRWCWIEIGIILLGALILRAMLLHLPPGLSRDSWRYLWDARVTLHGFSPYVYAPFDKALIPLRDLVLLPNSRFRTAPTIYPPGAQGVYLLSYLLAGSNLYFLKGIFLIFDMVTCIALVILLGRKGLDQRRVILYAWCPLPIIEFAIEGHVDVITLTFTILAVLAATNTSMRGRLLSGFLIGLATLTKIYPILLLVALVPALLATRRDQIDRAPRMGSFIGRLFKKHSVPSRGGSGDVRGGGASSALGWSGEMVDDRLECQTPTEGGASGFECGGNLRPFGLECQTPTEGGASSTTPHPPQPPPLLVRVIAGNPIGERSHPGGAINLAPTGLSWDQVRVIIRYNAPILIACCVTILLGYLPYLILGHGQVLGYFASYASEQGENAGVAQQLVSWLGAQYHLPLTSIISIEHITDVLLIGATSLIVFVLRLYDRISMEVAVLLLFGVVLSISSHVFPWYTTTLLLWVPVLIGPLWKHRMLVGRGLAIIVVWYFTLASIFGYFFKGIPGRPHPVPDWTPYYNFVYWPVVIEVTVAALIGIMNLYRLRKGRHLANHSTKNGQ